MTTDQDIRWVQRLANYKKAFAQLKRGVELASQRELSDLEKEEVIQRFEYSQELAWQTIKDFYKYLGETGIQGSRDAFRLAMKRGLIHEGKIFMESIKSRNKTVHTYNEAVADEIFHAIIDKYYQVFADLIESLEKEKQKRGL